MLYVATKATSDATIGNHNIQVTANTAAWDVIFGAMISMLTEMVGIS